MADSLRSTTPVTGAGGFAGRASPEPRPRAHPGQAAAEREATAGGGDRVELGGAGQLARRLLRQRVLAGTRAGLELPTADGGPVFAEVIDEEPLPLFVDRLWSAQNQLGARRLAAWGAGRVRQVLDAALRRGADETIDLLLHAGSQGEAGAGVVAAVLAEYARRLAALAGSGPVGEPPA